MKLKLNPLAKDAGNALLTTVIFIVVLTLSIGGYMTYVLQQVRLGGRSQAWNMAMAVSEAGIEEGFEHLNDEPTNSMGSDGWTGNGDGTYTVTRTLNGTFQSSYTVTINFSDPLNPSITSAAYVTPPAAARNTGSPFFYATATPNNQTVSSSTTTVGRGILAVLNKPVFFNAAMIARGNINLNGNRITVDSFDSGIAGQNVNGQWSSSVSGDDGIVASDGGISNSVNVGNANIYGPLYTGAGEPATVGPNGAVGTHTWQLANGSGIEPGYWHQTANFAFPPTSLPSDYSTYPTPNSGSVVQVTGTNIVAATNTTPYYPTGLTNGQTLSAVTTNQSSTTVSTYPGAIPGLSSNLNYVTVSSYPGPEPGLGTNCVNTVIVTSNPGSQPCLSSGTLTTNVNGSSSYPAPGTYVGNVTTNYTGKKVSGYTYTETWYSYSTAPTYTYQAWAYTYPTTTYTYTIYSSSLSYVTNNYDAVLSGGNYTASSLGNTIITGPVTLVMPTGYNINNLTIAPGGSLTLYLGGTSVTISGNTIVNQPGLSQNLIVYCAPTVTSLSLSGNAGFNGVIVAPNANVDLSGGGNNAQDFSGSLLANTVTLHGHWNFHYDVALSRMPASKRYILETWQEIPVPPKN